MTSELKKVEIEKKEIDLAVMKVFPDGNIKTAEDLNMTLTMLKDQLTEVQNKKTELTQLGSAAQAKQVQVTKVKEEESFQMQRAQRLALNSLVATVIAVNKEWDFVMINAGRAHGVSAEASLLVKRAIPGSPDFASSISRTWSRWRISSTSRWSRASMSSRATRSSSRTSSELN